MKIGTNLTLKNEDKFIVYGHYERNVLSELDSDEPNKTFAPARRVYTFTGSVEKTTNLFKQA